MDGVRLDRRRRRRHQPGHLPAGLVEAGHLLGEVLDVVGRRRCGAAIAASAPPRTAPPRASPSRCTNTRPSFVTVSASRLAYRVSWSCWRQRCRRSWSSLNSQYEPYEDTFATRWWPPARLRRYTWLVETMGLSSVTSTISPAVARPGEGGPRRLLVRVERDRRRAAPAGSPLGRPVVVAPACAGGPSALRSRCAAFSTGAAGLGQPLLLGRSAAVAPLERGPQGVQGQVAQLLGDDVQAVGEPRADRRPRRRRPGRRPSEPCRVGRERRRQLVGGLAADPLRDEVDRVPDDEPGRPQVDGAAGVGAGHHPRAAAAGRPGDGLQLALRGWRRPAPGSTRAVRAARRRSTGPRRRARPRRRRGRARCARAAEVCCTWRRWHGSWTMTGARRRRRRRQAVDPLGQPLVDVEDAGAEPPRLVACRAGGRSPSAPRRSRPSRRGSARRPGRPA